VVIELNKPVYLMPFTFLYKLVIFIFGLIFRIIRYFNVGLFFTIYLLANIIVSFILLETKGVLFTFISISYLFYSLLKHITNGYIVLCYFVYRYFRYVGLCIAIPFVLIKRGFDKLADVSKQRAEERLKKQQEREELKEKNRLIQEENQKIIEEQRQKELEEELNKRIEEKDAYYTETIKIEKRKFSDVINDWLNKLAEIPKNIKKYFAGLSTYSKVKNDINRQALLIDFEGADAEKSVEKVMYKYIIKNPAGKIVQGYFPAHSKVEVHSFLLSEGNEVYSIETNKFIQFMHGRGDNTNKSKIKNKDLIFFTTQLSTYLKAGITLVESLKILSRQFNNKTYSRIFRSLIYDLSMGDSFSQAMDKQGEAFPRLFINMVKASEMTGELPEVLDDMADYFTETDKTRKQMITAMTYPSIIFVLAMAAVVFIMVWVVPKFVAIYEGIDGAEIPGITVFVMNLSAFLQKYFIFIIIGLVVFILIFVYLYRNVKAFKTFIQWILMHIPVIGNVIIYNEVTMFTKTFASLLSHNVYITDSMDILRKLTNNEVYKSLIFDTIDNLAKGEKISLAFDGHWAFPMPAYEMIKTGEITGQLPEMMSKVSSYYQELHRNSVTRIKTFVEPALILFLTFVVGGIVLSIVIPMFSVYGAMQV